MASYNPWMVNSVHDFWFLKCPECSFDSKEEESFQAHALEEHPLSFTLFGKTVKEEAFDNNYEFAENNQDYPEAYENQGSFVDVQIKEEFIEKKDGIEKPSKNLSRSGIYQFKDYKFKDKEKKVKKTGQLIVKEQMLCQICPILELTTSARELRAHRTPNHKKGKQFYCPHCDHLENSWSTLVRHVSENHQEHYEENFFSNVKPLKTPKQESIVKEQVICEMCPVLELTTSNNKLSQHRKKYHREGREFKCPHCDKKSNVWINILTHVHAHHSEYYEKKYSCEICHESFIFSIILRRHEKSAHIETGKQTHICDTCGSDYVKLSDLKKHIRLKHNTGEEITMLFCEKCGYSTADKSVLRNHMYCRHNPEKHKKCQYCDFTSPHNNKVHVHIDINHPEKEEKNFLCEKCNKAFIYKASFVDHSKFKCKYSDYFEKRKEIAKKCAMKTKKLKERLFQCDYCDEKIKGTASSIIRKHYSLYHGSKPILDENHEKFKCTHCRDVFLFEHEFDRHKNLAHGIKTEKNYCPRCKESYVNEHKCQKEGQHCDQCGKTFSSKQHLDGHIKVEHLKILDVECAVCGKKVGSKTKLLNHMFRCHSQVTCEICNKEIANPYDLKRHKLIVHKDTTGAWLCRRCPKSAFFTKSKYDQHMRDKH